MYAGNHSPHHPLDTLLESVRIMPDTVFCFVGGGTEFSRMRRIAAEGNLANIRLIPYVPMEKLSGVLSAADAHIVVQHDAYVGLAHPSKIYNVLAVGVPVIYIGPPESHVAETLRTTSARRWSFVVRHGDVDGLIRSLHQVMCFRRTHSQDELDFALQFSQAALMPRMALLIMNHTSGKDT